MIVECYCKARLEGKEREGRQLYTSLGYLSDKTSDFLTIDLPNRFSIFSDKV